MQEAGLRLFCYQATKSGFLASRIFGVKPQASWHPPVYVSEMILNHTCIPYASNKLSLAGSDYAIMSFEGVLTNSVNQNEMGQNKTPHQELHYLHS